MNDGDTNHYGIRPMGSQVLDYLTGEINLTTISRKILHAKKQFRGTTPRTAFVLEEKSMKEGGKQFLFCYSFTLTKDFEYFKTQM